MEAVVALAALAGGDFLRTWTELAAASHTDEGRDLAAKLRYSLVERREFPGIVDWFLVQRLSKGAIAVHSRNDGLRMIRPAKPFAHSSRISR